MPIAIDMSTTIIIAIAVSAFAIAITIAIITSIAITIAILIAIAIIIVVCQLRCVRLLRIITKRRTQSVKKQAATASNTALELRRRAAADRGLPAEPPSAVQHWMI